MADATLITHRNLGAKAALVFLHGFSGDAAKTWGHFPEFVSGDQRFADWDVFSVGYTTRLVPDIVGIWSADAPLDRLSLQLANTASVVPLSSYKTLAFTAHSMGGLILQRALVDTESLSDRTSHVTLYGTPSGGLSKAGPFSFFKRQVRD